MALLEKRHPTEIELGLDRVARVGKRLGVLQPAPRIISVAGTNGKGSCVAALERLYILAGSRVGAFTSPHLLRFNERIRIDGLPLSDNQICSAFEIIEAQLGDVSLTYFEFTTLAALLLFRDAGLDIVVLEVGLGGRLDAVNIVDADVSVVTSIDLDHQAWLGNDRASIALEKAGIARAGRAVVCGDPDPPISFRQYLDALGSVTHSLGGERFRLFGSDSGLTLVCSNREGKWHHYLNLPQPLLPELSVACAVQAMILAGDVPTADMVQEVFAQCRLPGRFQLHESRGRRVLLDVAHNPAAARRLAGNLHKVLHRDGRVYAVFGVMGDKDIKGIIEPLLPVMDDWVACDLRDCPRAAKAANLAEELTGLGARASARGGVEDALLSIFSRMRDNDLVLVFGSFYTVAEALDVLSRFSDEIG